MFCERASYLFFRLRLDTDQAFQKIVLSLEKYNFRAAIEECTRIEKHPLGRILKAGIMKSDKRDKEIERAMEEEIIREIPQDQEQDKPVFHVRKYRDPHRPAWSNPWVASPHSKALHMRATA
ncbi:MAG: MotA/TolQ/ExbB proton channel family protein [Comamonadaceae bacterium]|nr:MotA/TolQ/ExbB proton channel family protein [Comamonadaceae bacterium]